MDAPETAATANATGIDRHSPDNSRMSRVPARTSTSPTIMNSAALNTAWAATIATAAKVALAEPSDSSASIRPNWDTVPQARMSLASTCRSAPIAPQIIDSSPRVSPSGFQTATSANTGEVAATRKTPALTMVAECR